MGRIHLVPFGELDFSPVFISEFLHTGLCITEVNLQAVEGLVTIGYKDLLRSQVEHFSTYAFTSFFMLD